MCCSAMDSSHKDFFSLQAADSGKGWQW
jgi:hypothetical protein